MARAARDQRRIHSTGRDHRADVCRDALRGSHPAAGAGKPRTRGRRSRGHARRKPGPHFFSIIAPTLLPTIITGFALAFARAVGEYGSIVFISGNQPFKTEIAPYLIVMRLDEYDYTGAVALAVVLMVISFAMLYVINWLETWSSRFQN